MTDGAEKKLRVGVMSFAHMHAYSYARAVCSLPDAQLVGLRTMTRREAKQQPSNTALTISTTLSSCWIRGGLTLSSSVPKMLATETTWLLRREQARMYCVKSLLLPMSATGGRDD